MKKLFTIGYSASAFNIALFILRVGAGILMLHHGYDKLVHFQDYAPKFINFLGLGGNVSLSLVIFAEFFCAIFLILGLFSRLAAIPLIIDMTVAIAKGHNMDLLGDGERPALFLLIFIAILFIGPGKVSVDGMISK